MKRLWPPFRREDAVAIVIIAFVCILILVAAILHLT